MHKSGEGLLQSGGRGRIVDPFHQQSSVHSRVLASEQMQRIPVVSLDLAKFEQAALLTLDLGLPNSTLFSRECIESLGLDWADELAWVTELACDNPKNYQIWHHRRCCLIKLGGQGNEIEFLNDFLTDEDLEDGKNYHAWAHRCVSIEARTVSTLITFARESEEGWEKSLKHGSWVRLESNRRSCTLISLCPQLEP